MKPIDRIAWGLVGLAVVLIGLGYLVPREEKSNFFTILAERQMERLRLRGAPSFRGPAVLPLPQRYIERTRAEVERLMAAPGWKLLSREVRAQRLLEVLLTSGIDADYWSMPEERQRRVADAYVRAFLDPH